MSGISMHDHEKKPKGGIFCPLMKEMCHDGWTESMGVSLDEKMEKPTCVRWVGVFVNDPRSTPPIKEIFDCKDRWDVDLIQQVAQEVFQGAAATEQVRNQVAESNGVSKIALSFFHGIAKRMHALPPPLTANQLANGKGGQDERHGAEG